MNENSKKIEQNTSKNRNLQEQVLKITRVKIATKRNENLTKHK